MSYIGNSITQQSFTGGMDQFNGNASNTAFGLSRTINTVYDVEVYVESVFQRPGIGYTVSANTITFTSAPASGSNNVVVVYKNFSATSIVPQQGSVITSSLGSITNINAGTNAALTLQANNATVLTVAANGHTSFGNTTVTGTLAVTSSATVGNTTINGGGTVTIASPTGAYKRVIFQDNDPSPTKYSIQLAVQEVNNTFTIDRAAAGNTSSWTTAVAVSGANGNVGISNTIPTTTLQVGTPAKGIGNQGLVQSQGVIETQGSTPTTMTNVNNYNGVLWRHQGWGVLSTDPGKRFMAYLENNNGDLTFKADSNTNVMAIRQDGVVDLSLGQLKFPATQNASSDANTLDDYEEGTWAPNVGGNATYGNQYGTYVKVGRIVHVNFDMTIGTIGTGSTTTIQNFPFTSASNGFPYTGCISYYSNLSVAPTFIAFYVENNATTCKFVWNSTGSATVQNNSGGIFTTNSRVLGSISYLATA